MGKRDRDVEHDGKHRKKSKKNKHREKRHKKSADGYCSSTFFAACREGDLKSAKRHLRHDPALLVRTNALGNSCLHLACEFGHAPLVSYFYKKGHSAHLSRANHSGLTPQDLGLDELLQQSGNKYDRSSTDNRSRTETKLTKKQKKEKEKEKEKQKKKKHERHRRDSRLSPSWSSPSSSTSSAGLLTEPGECTGGYRDPHANGDVDGAGGSAGMRAAAQWRKLWEQERRSDEQEWAEKIADEAAAESGEWGWGGSRPGTNGMAWGGHENQWEDEEQADATAREDWMDEVAAELQRKRAMQADAKRRQRAEEHAAAGHKKQQYGDDRNSDAHSHPRPHNGGAGRSNNQPGSGSNGIPGHRPGVGSAGGDFAGMRGTGGAGTGPTRESAAVINARLRTIRESDEKRWEEFIEKFGRKILKQGHGRQRDQSSEPAAPADAVSPGPQAFLRESDIPWPQGMGAANLDVNVLSLPTDLPAADVKVAVRTAQRRWHPDKFAQRFGHAMASLIGGEAERVRVLEKVKLLAQQINEIAIPEEVAADGRDESEHVDPSGPRAT